YLTVESSVVVPVDPLGGGQLDLGERFPGPPGLDQLSFVQADRGFHEGVVVCVADGADGRGDAGGLEVLGELERRVLRPCIRVMYQLTCLKGLLVAVALPD